MTQTRQGRVISVFVWPTEGANPPSAFPFPHSRATAAFWRVLGSPADGFTCLCEEAKLGGFRADFEGEKNNEKFSDGPLLFLDYYGIILAFLERERPAKRTQTKTEKQGEQR